jgi:hypothetical protein
MVFLFIRLRKMGVSGDLCVDSRPAVRKSAGQTLFSTISAHGGLLHQPTWQAVLWQVRMASAVGLLTFFVLNKAKFIVNYILCT